MTEAQQATAIRLLREQVAIRENRNTLIRNQFGERITIALTAECAQRDREIEAMDLTIALIEAGSAA